MAKFCYRNIKVSISFGHLEPNANERMGSVPKFGPNDILRR